MSEIIKKLKYFFIKKEKIKQQYINNEIKTCKIEYKAIKAIKIKRESSNLKRKSSKKNKEGKRSKKMSLVLTNAVEKGLKGLCVNYGNELIKKICVHYKLDEKEVKEVVGLEELKVTKKSVKKESKKSEKKEKKEKKEKPTKPLPFDGKIFEENCKGIKKNHGLMTQCWNDASEGDEYCKTCRKQADKNSNGKPNVGDIRDRLNVGIMEYRDPKGNKVVPLVKVMKKLKLERKEIEEEASKFGIEIKEEQMEEVERKRGRPKKSVEVSDTESEEGKPKRRGRKSKNKVVVSSGVEDDLIQAMKEAEKEAKEVEELKEELEESVDEEKVEKKVVINEELNEEYESGIDSGVDESDEESDDEEAEAVQVKKIEIEGKEYLITEESMLYDTESHDLVGYWNIETKEIEEVDDEDSGDEDEVHED